MKLLLCLKCSDIFPLIPGRDKSCHCGLTSGENIDGLNVEISGPCIPIGFKNSSFIQSLKMQIIENKHQLDKPTCCDGVDFTAFFIHESATSVKRLDDYKPTLPGL